MSLEQMYNDAASNTYVGTVRTRQESGASVTGAPIVNFLDGNPTQPYRQGVAGAPDEFQTEFKRNRPNQFKASGAQGVVRGDTQTYTRWSDKAFKIAFDGEGPVTLARGFYNNKFRTDPVSNALIHSYTPAEGKRFSDVNNSARTRANSSPSGAPVGF